jgi:predicted dehydrogenase
METIKIGVVGAGGNTITQHIPKLQVIAGCEVVSVCNRSRASSQRVADQFGLPTVYDSWQELVAAPDTHAIVIGTWPYMHCRVTLAALASGKHVLCEARMAMNAHEAHAMRDAARAKPQLVAQVVPSPMTLGVDATIKRLLADGYLGDLLAIEVRDGNAFLDRAAALHWRQDFDLSGSNVMSLGIWYEAIMRWAGPATRVAAAGKTFVRMRTDAGGTMRAARVPEHIDVLAEMDCGAQAHIQISSVTGLAGAAEAWLFGSAGTLRFSAGQLYGGQRGDTQLHEISIPPGQAGGWRVEQEFVNAIRGQETITHTSFEDGVKYMEFTEAVARSMASGTAVALPL